MTGKKFQIYSIQSTGKCFCETFPPPLHYLIISPNVKHLPINLPEKVCSSLEKEKSYPILWEGGQCDLSSYLFHFLKVSFQTLAIKTMNFPAKRPSQCVFKVMQHSYEIFQLF